MPLPKPRLPTALDGVIPVLYGSDGFTTFCTVCEERVNPGPWPRASLQAAIADRIIHNRDHHQGAL